MHVGVVSGFSWARDWEEGVELFSGLAREKGPGVFFAEEGL